MAETFDASSATPLWLKLGVGEEEADGYFPATWLNECLDGQEAVLVRLDPQEQRYWSSSASQALRSLRSKKNWLSFLSEHENPALGLSYEINSYACPLSLAHLYMRSTGARNEKIPYVDTVLPASIDIHGHAIHSFVLNGVRPRPDVDVLGIRSLGSTARALLPL